LSLPICVPLRTEKRSVASPDRLNDPPGAAGMPVVFFTAT
jgi:hypothetical protein